jgi:hypothetical protein
MAYDMNNTDTKPNTVRNSVLDKIVKGEVSMRSKWQFTVRLAALMVLVLVLVVVSSFVVSFIIFGSKISGHLLLLGFGGQGIKTFFILFPWKLFALTILLFFVLRSLMQSFSWVYRNSYLSVFGAIVATSIILGSTITATPIHSTLLERADVDDLPLLDRAYESLHQSKREHENGVFKGVVMETFDGGFTLYHDDHDSDEDDGVITVLLPDGELVFEPGDMVFVAGRFDDGVIHAYGAREVDLDTLEPIRE